MVVMYYTFSTIWIILIVFFLVLTYDLEFGGPFLMFLAFCTFLSFSQSIIEYLTVFIKILISSACNLLSHLLVFLYLFGLYIIF
jgi:hypothetical protein